MENDLMPLLPCPFCGEKAYYWHGKESGLWSVGCMNEQCFGYAGAHHKNFKEVVVEAWNTRYERTCIVLEEFGDDYVCDACGEVLRSGYDDPFEAIPLERFKYCFGCGARVKEDADADGKAPLPS